MQSTPLQYVFGVHQGTQQRLPLRLLAIQDLRDKDVS